MNMLLPLNMGQFRSVVTMLAGMYAGSRLLDNIGFVQHGSTNLHEHCKNVALLSLDIADRFHITVDRRSLIRGALLHDYYLYDWHDKNARPHLHGFVHPSIALKNARRDFDLNDIEADIIVHHMFPLTFFPPMSREGWIVTIADKLCSLYETFRLNEHHVRRRRRVLA